MGDIIFFLMNSMQISILIKKNLKIKIYDIAYLKIIAEWNNTI